jgi:hypothetical protein
MGSMASKNPPWSREENEATVASYFAMLAAALRGARVNKTTERRSLLELLNGRTEGAIEFKHQNISAILIELGVPYITGYKPAKNYQEDLRPVILSQLMETRLLREVIRESVMEVPAKPQSVDLSVTITCAPKPRTVRQPSVRNSNSIRPPVDYLRMEAQNSALGLAGELFVLEIERERLGRAGKGNLAAQVTHISAERGDGLGYDVLSFEENSRERLIEVKTTKYGEYTPFYLSRNELDLSRKEADKFQLYRVYEFGKGTRIFFIPGPLDLTTRLECVTYLSCLA